MSAGLVVGIVIVVIAVLAAAGWFAYQQLQRRQLRERFGPEYDRLLAERQGDHKAARQELAERQKRHAELDIQPVSATSRERYMRSWSLVQSQFVDHPSAAVDEADRLVTTIMAERGYPTDDLDVRLAVLSVDHGRVLEEYRRACETRARHERSQVSTEALRTAMVRYRVVIEDLLDLTVTGKSLSTNGKPAASESDRMESQQA